MNIVSKEYIDISKCIIILGMAGSGKTSLVNAFRKYCCINQENKSVYCINLDPAVHHIPYEANIDIRNIVDYKKLMKLYQLGPNGSILTSLNMFITKVDEFCQKIRRKKEMYDFFLIDTPGQLEVFTWSVSGEIIIQCIQKIFPSSTIIFYVIDIDQCQRDKTSFTTNILYACSLMCRFHPIPFIIVFNKCDLFNPKNEEYYNVFKWIENTNELNQDMLKKEEDMNGIYGISVYRLMERFFKNVPHVCTSCFLSENNNIELSSLYSCISNLLDINVDLHSKENKEEIIMIDNKNEVDNDSDNELQHEEIEFNKFMKELNLNV